MVKKLEVKKVEVKKVKVVPGKLANSNFGGNRSGCPSSSGSSCCN